MITYEIGGIELIDKMKELWEAQRDYHGEVSTHFADKFYKMDFESRKKSLVKSSKKLKFVLAKDTEYIGFCISTLDSKHVGEVFSLYVNPDYRGLSIGVDLMTSSLEWMKEQNAIKIHLSVAEGNEGTYKFYEKFGFYPYTTSFEIKE
ncbi:MAG: GNAT family N-acetyltransferase [Clostridiales bacterium]|nr:GNAT family N-acetyltransferase [Clostridiales bacterium]